MTESCGSNLGMLQKRWTMTEEMKENRNILVESARIARGQVEALEGLKAENFDALIVPGGFGAAKNLSDFAVNVPECQIHPDVQRLLIDMMDSAKPVGALCIAPATLVRAVGNRRPRVTIGNDTGTAAAIETMGGGHADCPVSEILQIKTIYIFES